MPYGKPPRLGDEEPAGVERSARVATLRFSESLCQMAAMKLRHAAALALVGEHTSG
jgi:hypothetical protein